MTVTAREKLKRGARSVGLVLLVLGGWMALMATFLALRTAHERDTLPPDLPGRIFATDIWRDGYFFATGSYKNDNSSDPHDQVIPQTIFITCTRSVGMCNIGSADVTGRALSLDVANYIISSWDDRQITVEDTSPICTTQTFVIDRIAETLTLIVRNKLPSSDYSESIRKSCSGTRNKHISLVDGRDINKAAKEQYDKDYGPYQYAMLIGLNVIYFGAIWLLWRRRRR